MSHRRLGLLAAASLVCLLPTTADAQFFGRGKATESTSVINEVPRCTQNFGTLAIADTQSQMFSQLGLGSPTEVLRHLIRESGCFRLIERGPGMDVVERERSLGAAGRIRTADFVLVAELGNTVDAATEDRSSGLMGTLMSSGARMALTAGMAALTQGEGGAELGQGMSQLLGMGANVATNQLTQSLNRRTVDSLKELEKDLSKGKEDAQVVMSLSSVPLAETVGYTRAIANKDDLRRLRIRDNHFGGRVGAGYESEDSGKTVALALVRAYADLVTSLGGTGDATPEVVVANREALRAAEAEREAEADRARQAEIRERERAEQARLAEENRIREQIRREERERLAAEREAASRLTDAPAPARQVAAEVKDDTNPTPSRAAFAVAPTSHAELTTSRTSVLRDAPSGRPVKALNPGDTLRPTGNRDDSWIEVRTADDTTGWVQADRI